MIGMSGHALIEVGWSKRHNNGNHTVEIESQRSAAFASGFRYPPFSASIMALTTDSLQ